MLLDLEKNISEEAGKDGKDGKATAKTMSCHNGDWVAFWDNNGCHATMSMGSCRPIVLNGGIVALALNPYRLDFLLA